MQAQTDEQVGQPSNGVGVKKADAKVVDRIRKLMALSRSDNMHEAQKSAEMAHKLMNEHGLTLQDIEGENSPIGEHMIESERFLEPWRWGLLTASAWRFYGHTVRIEETYPGSSAKKVFAMVIANKTDLKVVESTFLHFEAAIEAEVERAIGASELHGNLGIDSFRRGCTVAVQERLLSRVENDLLKTRRDTLSKGAMVLVKTKAEKEAAKERVAEKFPDAKRPQMYGRTETSVFEKGYEFGKRIRMPGENGKPQEMLSNG